ncbi:MAG: ABC transporter substrate-binding protein [Acidisphaera sp.]|nr:ABC transporter substrate-binding protein [Acidisphaera sp.]
MRNGARRVLVGLLLAGCALTASPARATEIRVGFTQDALTLDPANPGNRDTETIIRNMYDGLLTRDPAMRVVPEIAESWRQADPLTYEFRLREGVRFHDGTTLTAEDVKFTMDRVLNGTIGGQTNPRRDLLGPLQRVDVVDPRTVRFVLAKPWPLLPAMLPFQEIVSQAFVKRMGDQGLVTEEDGTGPFRLREWRRGDSIVMERVPDYYEGATDIPPAGPARVDRVIYRIMPDNAARVAALLAGDVDIINALPVTAVRQVNANPGTQVATVNGTRTFFLAINNAKPPFSDVRVRRALNHAVDRKLIIARLLNGLATPLNGVLSPDAFGFDPELPEYTYDPGKARALLAEAGVSGLSLTIDTDGAGKEISEAIASMLARSGIMAKVQVWETAVLVPIWRDPAKRADHDLFFTSWGNASLDPSDIMIPAVHSGGRGNTAGYANPEVDRLLDAAETEVDRDKRRALYMQAQTIINADAPWVFLWLPQDVYGVSKRVHGWKPSADSKIDLSRATVE